MKRALVILAATALAAGCTVTAKPPVEQLHAQNAAMEHMLNATTELHRSRDVDRAERAKHMELLGVWGGQQQTRAVHPGYAPQPMPHPGYAYPPVHPGYGYPPVQQHAPPPVIVMPPPQHYPAPTSEHRVIMVPQSPSYTADPALRSRAITPDHKMPQPHPPAQHCIWTCDQISNRCGYSCTATGGPVVYPTQPPPGATLSPEVENPRFHNNKG